MPYISAASPQPALSTGPVNMALWNIFVCRFSSSCQYLNGRSRMGFSRLLIVCDTRVTQYTRFTSYLDTRVARLLSSYDAAATETLYRSRVTYANVCHHPLPPKHRDTISSRDPDTLVQNPHHQIVSTAYHFHSYARFHIRSPVRGGTPL